MEMESKYSMEVAVESTEFHGYLRDGIGSANAIYYQMYFE